ncbi:hypothetical protein [Nesterenkonia rhizosphaerae]|uniref:DUF4224 domain-containing protein n=1 Tax=Nesterenkonia rhizosphaerae TaxID=1348272 RepID=A0ABP9FU39_9MICC
MSTLTAEQIKTNLRLTKRQAETIKKNLDKHNLNSRLIEDGVMIWAPGNKPYRVIDDPSAPTDEVRQLNYDGALEAINYCHEQTS